MNNKLLLAPHNDDETLWTGFTIQQERERLFVAVVFDSHVQVARGFPNCDTQTRRLESVHALDILLGSEPQNNRTFLGVPDTDATEDAVRKALTILRLTRKKHGIEQLWLPAVEENGHPHHNLVGKVGAEVFHDVPLMRYLTYTSSGKSRGKEVPPRSALEIQKKHQALACYASQMQLNDKLGCSDWFLNDLREYVLE